MLGRRRDGRSEPELVAAFRERGDPADFEALYLRARREVFHVCRRLLRDEAAAEEATHDTFLRAYERFSTLRGENFSGWVHRIATNLCLNRIRDRRPIAAVSEDLADPSTLAGASSPVAPEELDRASAILAELRPAQRQALILKYLEGRSYEEIGRITGESVDMVRSHLQNGRRNFKILWERRAAAWRVGNG